MNIAKQQKIKSTSAILLFCLGINFALLPPITLAASSSNTSVITFKQQNTISNKTNSSISREEFLREMIEYHTIDITNTPLGPLPFTDLSPRHPSYSYFSYVYAKKIWKGYENNTIRPQFPITKGEAAKTLILLLDIPITPCENSCSWSDPYIKQLNERFGTNWSFKSATEFLSQENIAQLRKTPNWTNVSKVDLTQEDILENITNVKKNTVTVIATKNEEAFERSLRYIGLGNYSKATSKDALVLASNEDQIGSGFFIDNMGMIVTNKHVINMPDSILKVITDDEQILDVQEIITDPINDLAFLRVTGEGLPSGLTLLPKNQAIVVGHEVFSVGTALGKYTNTVHRGIISGLHRTVDALGDDGLIEHLSNLIQTDVGISQGNSGGPLAYMDGTIVGMNTALDTEGVNIGFALPSDDITVAYAAYKHYGYIPRPLIGINYVSLTPTLAKQYKLSQHRGAYLISSEDTVAVLPESPASRAGLKEKDIILSINKQPLRSTLPLSSFLTTLRFEETILLEIDREGKHMEVTLKLENKKE